MNGVIIVRISANNTSFCESQNEDEKENIAMIDCGLFIVFQM